MLNTQSTDLLFELSKPGRRCHRLPTCDVPAQPASALLPARALADAPPPLPEIAEIDLIRHFNNLSQRNFSIDTNFYPLGSCTMKYNPKRHERLAALSGLAGLHPLQDDDSCQGMLQLLYEMQQYLAEISGLPAVSLQPAAGAHGELTALFVAAAYFRDKKETHRRKVLVPDSAHGTNPASAALAGFEAVTVKGNAQGLVDLVDLAAKLGDDTAVFMITNPNTLGLFEKQIKTITELLHAKGALVYLDGANMNAILGITRPGDFGADMQHYNVHKTFTGPHGGGGPGSGPIAVRDFLAPYLPAPLVACRLGSGQWAVGSQGWRSRAKQTRWPLFTTHCPLSTAHFVPGLRPPQVDRPGAQLLRQRRHPIARLPVYPHARAGRIEGCERTCRPQRQLSARTGQRRL